MNKILVVSAVIFLYLSISLTTFAAQFVHVKYRADPVDISSFEYQDTSKSSFVRGAWYDEEHEYMIIQLKDTKYHYCRMPSSVWNSFQMASSYGRFYSEHVNLPKLVARIIRVFQPFIFNPIFPGSEIVQGVMGSFFVIFSYPVFR